MHSVFRLVMLALVVGYSLPRVYYRRRARHARMKEESTRPPVTENKWRLALMGIGGGGANLVGLAWLVNPDWLSWSNLDLPVWLRWVGTGLGVLAIVLGSLSHRTLDVNFTPTLRTLSDHQLVTHGIYRWIRHPLYTSFFVLFTAAFLISTNWLIGVLGVCYSMLVIDRVRHEEAMLINAFGEAYRRYMQRSGRFLPRLNPD